MFITGAFLNCPAECKWAAGDAIMGMIVTHLVFSSTSNGDCETLHDRRKVMVRPAASLTCRLAVAVGCVAGYACNSDVPISISTLADSGTSVLQLAAESRCLQRLPCIAAASCGMSDQHAVPEHPSACLNPVGHCAGDEGVLRCGENPINLPCC